MRIDNRNPSRRLFLSAGSSSAVFGALPHAAAAERDPIFAAIERHKAAWCAFEQTCELTDVVLAREEGREVRESDLNTHAVANHEEDAALEALLETPPTTKAGARAAIEWLLEYNRGCEPREVGVSPLRCCVRRFSPVGRCSHDRRRRSLH